MITTSAVSVQKNKLKIIFVQSCVLLKKKKNQRIIVNYPLASVPNDLSIHRNFSLKCDSIEVMSIVKILVYQQHRIELLSLHFQRLVEVNNL